MSSQHIGCSARQPETSSGSQAHRRNIFIVHPSVVLTDSRAHGDGLLAYRFICELAARGHHLSVACENIELTNPLPANISLYPIVSRSRRLGLLRRLEYAVRMRQLFTRLHAERPFDIAHQLNPVYAGLSLGLTGTDIPLVLGPYVAHWPSARSSKLQSMALRVLSSVQQNGADAVLLSGDAARSRIVAKRFPASKIFTVPYGIDLQTFPEQPLPSGDPVILYLAGFHERKGLPVLLESFDHVAAQIPNARLTIAGDGIEGQRMRELAARSPYRERITFAGVVARSDVPNLIARCTVFCLPSFGEPYGMSLIEAMATGRAVVATNSGGPADLVRPGGGTLVAPGDTAALARALVAILENRPRAAEMGANNRRAMLDFSWPAIITKLENVYENVISRRSTATR